MKKALTSALLLTLLVAPVLVSAQPAGVAGENTDVEGVIIDIVDWLFAILLIAAVVVILIAAFTFLTAAGDAEKVAKARNYIIYALVAIVVAFLSRAIVDWFGEILV